MDLRAGSPAAERRTRSRSFRGPILAGPASSCAHDDDRLRFPPASPAQNSTAGKKKPTDRRRNPPCRRYVTPSSKQSLAHPRRNARTAENGFATSSGVSKSAKVVLGGMCGSSLETNTSKGDFVPDLRAVVANPCLS